MVVGDGRKYAIARLCAPFDDEYWMRRQRLCFVEGAERSNERASGIMPRNRRRGML